MCSGASRAWWWRRCVLLGTMFSWMTLVQGCPSMCTCKWKGGKEWVECANRDLKGLPQGAREETQVLDLSNNHLVGLPSECFHALGLTNLQKLYLGRSRISYLAPTAFVGLVGLVELDLSGNRIEHVPTKTFTSCPNLMRLNLNSNPIREIRREAFKPLMQLTNLDLSQSQLEIVEQGAFDGLNSLEWLRLDGNKLTYIPDMTLPLGGNLHGITLHNNTWLCDCLLRPLQAWLQKSAATAPQEYEPICESPRQLQGRQIKVVKVSDLACLPQVSLARQADAYEGTNVSLRCDVYAVPTAKITWWFNGDLCEPQNENDSFTGSSSTLVRYVHKQRGHTNTTSTLHVQSLEPTDEGTYTCVAQNGAGSAEANLSLRVLFREKSTVEPPFDQPSTGYVAAIAAGALVGTLFALGCVIGSVLLCTKRRRDQKRNAKPLVSQNKTITPVAKDSAALPRKGNGNLSFEHQQQVMYMERDIGRTGTLERREPIESSYRNPVSKYLTEPDLINEVPETTTTVDGYNVYQHQRSDLQVLDYDTRYCMQPDLRPDLRQMSYLDQDGYPVDFGLPKISFNSASTLPRSRQRSLEGGSAAVPPARYSREAEFLARSTPYEVVIPRSDTRYTAEGYPYPAHQPVKSPVQQLQIVPTSPMSPAVLQDVVPFIPSPPAAYRGEPTTPLSPRSLLSKTAREAAAAAVARAGGAHLPEHTESPDEGYVGETMDV